jgi:Metalloenzyme superfamily
MTKLRFFLVLVAAMLSCAVPAPKLAVKSAADPPHQPLPALASKADVPRTRPAPEPRARRQSIVVVAIDGVRWQDVFEGVDPRIARAHEMPLSEIVGPDQIVPHLYALASGEGVAIGAPGHGAPIVASDAAVKSLPGYMEIFSGHPETRCRNNYCSRIRRPTLVDQLAAEPGHKKQDVAVIASWSGIGRAAAERPSRIAMSVGRDDGNNLDLFLYDTRAAQLLAAGRASNAWPGSGDYRPDRYTAAIALRYLRVVKPRFLFIGLGDTDEWGHKNKYRRYLAALSAADTLVGKVQNILSKLQGQGWSTALMITADHGRDPKGINHGGVRSAARTWLIAGGSLIRAHGFVRAPVRRHLADIAPTLRKLMGLAPDRAPGAGHVLEELL